MDIPEEEEKESKVPEELTCPEWMMTMGDCMSLLLTFFVLLLTFSSKEKAQLMDVIGVMKGAFSVWSDGSKLTVDDIENTKPTPSVDEDGMPKEKKKEKPRADGDETSGIRLVGKELERKAEEIEERLHEKGFRHFVNVALLERGLSIEVTKERLFDGQGQLTPQARRILYEAAAVVKPLAKNELQLVYVLGASTQSGPRFGNKWLAANNRLQMLAKALTENLNLAPERISHAIQVTEETEEDGKIRILIKGNSKLKQVTMDQIMNAGDNGE